MLKLNKVCQFRLNPTKQQAGTLAKMAGARRWVWNWGLARKQEHYKSTGKTLTFSSLCKEITILKTKEETSWLKECESQSLQQSLKDLENAFKRFFNKKSKYPKFKTKKKSLSSFRIPQNIKIEDSKIYCPKVGWIKLRQSQEIEGKTKSATFKKNPVGHWYVSVLTEFEMPGVALPLPKAEQAVGVDVGLKDFAVLSNGERTASPKFYQKAQQKLKRFQREFSRRKNGSKRKAKSRLKIAKLHAKIANSRNDFLHKLSTKLINSYDCICIEDLSVKKLMKTKLAKSFADASLGEFRRQLTYKALWNCKRLVVIDKYFPSSKLCKYCGAINEKLKLSQRTWTCDCGVVHDRDLNAAANILAEGMRMLAVGHTDSLNAHGQNVRPAKAGGFG